MIGTMLSPTRPKSGTFLGIRPSWNRSSLSRADIAGLSWGSQHDTREHERTLSTPIHASTRRNNLFINLFLDLGFVLSQLLHFALLSTHFGQQRRTRVNATAAH